MSIDTGASGTDDPRGAAPDQPGVDARPDNQAEGTGTGDAPTERPHPGGDADVLLDESPTTGRRASSDSPPEPEKNANGVYVIEIDGVDHAYKPASEENPSLRESIAHGGLAAREVAGFVLSEELGGSLVPHTRRWSGDRGPGSAQRWVDGGPAMPVDFYQSGDQEEMAVLDYVTGNTDRHDDNYLTDPGGRPTAIDHGYAFPESPVDPIRSSFVAAKLGQPLDAAMLDRIRAVDLDDIDRRLRAEGLNDSAVQGVIDRLTEIRQEGAITGAAWPGRIVDAERNTVKESDQ